MKIKSLACGLVAVFALSAGAQAARGASGAELLEQGIYLEETKSELKGASEVYGAE
jgi:hypothetical protein